MVVAPLVPAAGVEIADPAEESASSVRAPMEVQAPVVVAAARDCVHTGVDRGARHRAWTKRHDLCEGRVARVFRRDWRRVQEDLRLWESSFNVHAQSSSVLRGLQWSLTDSSEIMRLVVDNPLGVQRETVEMMTARVQIDENDDPGVRPVMRALLRTSTEMPDEQAETGFLDGVSLAHRLSDNECGQGELDSPEIRRSMVDRSVGVQCETVCARPVMMAPLKLSTKIPDEAAWGTLTPTTGATAAERRVFDGTGTDPPESGSSGSEREIRADPTVLAHHADSSLEVQCQCPAVGHETGYDEDVKVITHQVGSSFEAEHEARCDGDVLPKGTDGLWILRTLTRPPQVKARRPTPNLGRRRRTERTASPTRHTRQSWTSSLMPGWSWQETGDAGCLCARFRRRPPCSCGDWRNSLKSGSAWESSAGMTCDAMWHSACRLRMLSKTSIDARLPCTNREGQSALNDTEICISLAQGGRERSCVFFFFERRGP